MTVLGVAEGFIISLALGPNSMSPAFYYMLLVSTLLVILVILRFASVKVKQLDKEKENYGRGARGEQIVGDILAGFPDQFCVINDLTTPFGNLDHVVIGPTGVFALDTKNWRGVVSADGNGELLLNNKPTPKREIRSFTARIMSVREKVKLLAPGPDPFHNGLFVFTSALVDAKWGTTGNVRCMMETRLHDVIVENDIGKRPSKAEVELIARAFQGLAQMDPGFAPSQRPIDFRRLESAAVPSRR